MHQLKAQARYKERTRVIHLQKNLSHAMKLRYSINRNYVERRRYSFITSVSDGLMPATLITNNCRARNPRSGKVSGQKPHILLCCVIPEKLSIANYRIASLFIRICIRSFAARKLCDSGRSTKNIIKWISDTTWFNTKMLIFLLHQIILV